MLANVYTIHLHVFPFLFLFLGLGPYRVVLRVYSWLHTEESLLLGSEDHRGIKNPTWVGCCKHQILAVVLILPASTLKKFFLNFPPFPSGFNPEALSFKKNKALDSICKILIWDCRDILSREDPKTTHSIGSQTGLCVPSSQKVIALKQK